MSRTNTLLVILVIVAALLATGVTGYLYYSGRNRKSVSEEESVSGGGKLQPGTLQENQFAIGTKEVSRGTFESAAGGKIQFVTNGTLTELPLSGEVTVVCTEQDYTQIDLVDYSLSSGVQLFTPSILGSKLTRGEPVVIFAEEVGGILTANTVALSSHSCPE